MVAVEHRARGERPGHRQVRIDRRDVRDRGLLEVERAHVLAAVRDLEDRSRAAVVEQECLVALAAEVGSAPGHAEHLGGDPGRFVRREPGRTRLEDGAHDRRCYWAGGSKSLVRANRLPL